MSMVTPRSVPRFFLWVGLIVWAFLSVFPFFWMAIGTTLNPNDVVKGILIPGNDFLSNVDKATKNYNLPLLFFNSLFIATMTVLFGVTVNALAAYGFEKFPSKVREGFFGVLLLTLIMPQIAIVLPLFREIAFFGLLDSSAAIILPFLMSAFVIFFLRQNFKMFPTEIIEAGRIDGAGEFSIFWKLAFPAMKASFASAAILMFISQWNSFLWPLMTILTDANKTLPIAMSSMMSAYTVEYGGLMVIICVSLLPVLVLFVTMQKQFVAGLMGSLK
jgi:lactose/L-arabinose transport system permease protein